MSDWEVSNWQDIVTEVKDLTASLDPPLAYDTPHAEDPPLHPEMQLEAAAFVRDEACGTPPPVPPPVPPPPPPPPPPAPPRPDDEEVARGARKRTHSNWRNPRDGPSTSRSCRRRNQQQPPGYKKVIPIPTQYVGRLIGKGGNNIRKVENQTGAIVKVGESITPFTNITLIGSKEAISRAEIYIGNHINPRPVFGEPPPPPPPPRVYYSTNDDVRPVNWDLMPNLFSNDQCDDRFTGLPAVVKDFYHEHAEISAMTPSEVVAWRKSNHDIYVRKMCTRRALKHTPNPIITFDHAFTPFPDLLREIKSLRLPGPTPIQSQAWPIILRGDNLIAISPNNTGKTFAYLLPAFVHVDGQIIPTRFRKKPTALIVTANTELALEIEHEASRINFSNIKAVCFCGSTDEPTTEVDIVITTPGRLHELVTSKSLNTSTLSFIVLDEFDKIVDMCMESYVQKSLLDVRPDKQVVITSATWSPQARKYSHNYMRDTFQVNVGYIDLSTVLTVVQKIIFLEECDKVKNVLEILTSLNPSEKIIIFCGKKQTAVRLCAELNSKGFKCMSDDRDSRGNAPRSYDNIVISAGVTTHGTILPGATQVINFDFPRNIDEYVSKVGKATSPGRIGTATTFLTRENWAHARDLINILREAEQEIPDVLEQMARRFEAMRLKGNERGWGIGRGRSATQTQTKRESDKKD